MTRDAQEPATRERVTAAATTLFQEHGYAATGLKQIATSAGASFGSIYHAFPGGKAELAEQVIRESGEAYRMLVLAALSGSDDPVVALRQAFDAATDNLVASGYADVCPVATVALEVAGTDERLRLASAAVFASWVDSATEWFSRWTTAPAAADLAHDLVMLLEGGFLLARTSRDPRAMHAARDAMVTLLRAAPPLAH